MRMLARVLLGIALLAVMGPVREANAGASIDLLFVAHNGSPIAHTATLTAAPGDTLTMTIFLRNDEPLTLAVFSLNYDLDGDDELDVISAVQWQGVPISKSGADFFQPLGPLDPSKGSFVGSFQGATTNLSLPRVLPPSAGAFVWGYEMGTVIWKVNAGVHSDGVDIIAGLLNIAVDGFGDAGFLPLVGDALRFGSASVNATPEPTTLALLGLGLLGLGLVARRRAR